MIPMTCPSCGRRGTAPSDRVNIRMHCPKCDAVFHLDKHGKVKMGEPRTEGHGHHEHDAGPNRGNGREYEEPFATSLTQLVLKSPWPVKLLLVGLIAAAAWPFLAPKMTPKPEELSTLGRRVAYAFADKKPDDLKALATPGSDVALREWYDRLRPMFQFEGPHGDTPEGRLMVDASTAVKDARGTTARMMINVGHGLDKPVPEVVKEQKLQRGARKRDWEPGYKYHGSFTLPTVWTLAQGRWKLDGPATLALADPATSSPGRK